MLNQERLVSLDAFRGLTIAAMILVNNPGDWGRVYWLLGHAPWHGWTPTDLIFPFFLSMVGMALPFSRRVHAGEALRRALVLAFLGLFMAAYPYFDLATVRIPSVLVRISICYLAVWGIRRLGGSAVHVVVTLILLVGYWWLMTRVPLPDGAPPSLEAGKDMGAYWDRSILGAHLWKQSRTWDPEGLVSTLPAVATTLLGMMAGDWLRAARDETRKTAGLLLAGLVLVLLGLAWAESFPLNKSLWTSSYVVFTAGMAAYAFGLLYWVSDVRGHRAWCAPLVIYGRNAILVFVASGLVAKTLALVKITGSAGVPVSLQALLYRGLFLSWLPAGAASFAYALFNVVAWYFVLRELDRRRIYLKV